MRNTRTFLLTLLALGLAASPAAEAKKKAAKAPALETYSAYDPTQDPDADQSSTFQEPLTFEAYAAELQARKEVAAPVAAALAASAKPLPAAKRVTSLPTAAKVAPKVAKKALPKPAASALATEVAPARALAPVRAPVVAIARPAAELGSLERAVRLASASSPASTHLMPLKEYAVQACEAAHGIVAYQSRQGTIVDCVTTRHALTFAFAEDYRDAIVRALAAGEATGLPPMLALVVEQASDLQAVELTRGALARSAGFLPGHYPLQVRKIMLPEVSRALTH